MEHCIFLIQRITLALYCCMPWNAISRIWGWANTVPLPVFLRPIVCKCYSKIYGCNLSEMAEEDLRTYRNLGEFFRRSLKPHLRPICPISDVISPTDGKILNIGEVVNENVSDIKGLSYTLKAFLGPIVSESKRRNSLVMMEDSNYNSYRSALLSNDTTNTRLYHAVIYLAPGDYHRFHSAANWTVRHRRHFPGHLLSVNPKVATRVKGLFCLNERAVYFGLWKYGFFSYTAVGATNVGSIEVFCDKTLKTNRGRFRKKSLCLYTDQNLSKPNGEGVCINKGELFGEFNLGSTIVLLFEAPSRFQFHVAIGDRVLMGQPLGQA